MAQDWGHNEVVSRCDHGIGPSYAIKYEKFLDYLRKYWFLRKQPVNYSVFEFRYDNRFFFQVATLLYRIGNAADFNPKIYPAIILQILCGSQALLARYASHALTISSSVHYKSSLYHSRQETLSVQLVQRLKPSNMNLAALCK